MLKKLEEAQQATVETSSQKVRVLLKSPNFSKSQVVDGLLSVKLISKERNHAKEGFYDSVFQAMFQKAAIPDDLFKKYLEVLLGNKDDEKVMELTSNTMRNSRPKRRDSRRHCYSFGAYRHFQATCPFSVTSGASLLVYWHLVNKASGCNREKKFQRFGKC